MSQFFPSWLKYWSFSFSISPANEYSGLISFRMDWLDLLAVQSTLKSLLQHHNLKESILQCSASVKVVPNKLVGKDFDFTLDGEVYSYHGEKDLTEGFEIEYGDTSFTIKPKGTITDILRAVYPGSVVEDCRNFAYDDMFTLIVTSHDGESNVKVNFTVSEDTEGITITPDHIYF